MTRVLLLFCCFFHCAYSATPENRLTTPVEFIATVEKVAVSTRQAMVELHRNGTIPILAGPDPRFVLTVRIERTDTEIAGIAPGSTLVLGIHSPAMLFAMEPTAAVGRTFRFRMEKSVSDGKTSFGSLEATTYETP